MDCAKRMWFRCLPYLSPVFPAVSNLSQRLRRVVFSFSLLLMLLICGQSEQAYAQVLINELDCDQTSTDTLEFVELYDGGMGDTPLDSLVVVFFNGSDTASYDAFDLDGLSTDADGYFVLGNAAVPNVGLVFPNNRLQNGADAVALYRADESDFPNDTPVTTTDLIDAIVYDTEDPDHLGLLILLNPGEPQVNEDEGGNKDIHSNQRIPNGAGGLRNTSSYTQLPPTPGADNQAPPPSNSPPVLTPIPDQTMSENETLEVIASATDPDGDPITLSANNLPAFGVFSDNMDGTGTFTFTPGFDDAGTYSDIEVIAADDEGLADRTSFALTVNNVNRAPSMTPIANQSMDEGTMLSVPITATDPDNEPLTLATNNLPSFGTLIDNGDGTGSLDFAPTFDDAGTYPGIAVIATDGGGLADTTTFALTVNNVPLPDVVINELDSDTPGSDTEEFIELFDGGAGNTALDGLVVVFYNGSNDESYAAFDLDGFSTDADGFFLMGDEDVVPTPALLFGSTSLQNGADAVALYAGNASDFPNGTPVTTTNLLDAIVYDTDDADDPELLVLLNPGQPQVNENGAGAGEEHSNQRIPNGAGGARNTDTYTQLSPTPGAVNVAPPPPNNPPELTPIPDQEMLEGDSLNVAVSASDPDGDPITLDVNNLPAFGIFSDNMDGTGTITFTPDFNDSGVYGGIEVVATDDNGAADTTFFQLTVNNVNRAPAITPIPDQVVSEASSLTVNITASDPDSDPLTLSTNNLPSFGILNDNGDGTGTLEFAPAYRSAGVYPNIEVVVTDDGNLADTTSFKLTVTESRLPRLVINEIDADTPGSDMLEFVELFAGSDGNTPLDGLVLVFYNGSDDASYAAFDLDGLLTGPQGYFLAGNAMVSPTPGLIFSNGLLQNGADAVALYAGNASDFPNGTPVTTTNLIDAIVYDTDDPDDPELLALLNPGQPQVNENGRGDKDTHSNQRIPNATGGERNTETYLQLSPTPGTRNVLLHDQSPVLTEIPDQSMTEGEILEIDVQASDPQDDPITLTVNDLPLFGSFEDFGDGTGLIRFQPNFDDAGEYSDIRVIATDDGGYADTTSFGLTVTDVPVPMVVINEFDVDTPGSDTQEFIELYDGGKGNMALDALVVVLFNGSDDESYAAFDLDGFATDEYGYFLMGNNGVAPTPTFVFGNSQVQNGPDAIAVYAGSTSDFPDGTPITTDHLIDAVVYGTGDSDDPELLTLLRRNQPQVDEDAYGEREVHSNQRIPNGAGGARNTDNFVQAVPTPGAENKAFPDIAVTASELDFGEVEVGHEQKLMLAIHNLGPVSLNVISLEVTGTDAEQWHSLAGGPFTVASGTKRDVTVLFVPNSSGHKSARLSVVSDDPDQQNIEVDLSGIAVTIPEIAVFPEELKFGSVAVGSEKTKVLRVGNVGSGALDIERVFLRGTNANQYQLSGNTDALQLSPGTEASISVTFAPVSVGEKIAHVRFISNDPENEELNIPFDGEALADTAVSHDLAGIVVINEIHYNPATVQGSDNDFEFLELANTSDAAVDLNGVQFTDGVTHTFTMGDTLPANGFLILANNAASYPGSIEWSSGNLVNGGELIKLVDANGATVDSVLYGVSAPWPDEADGEGPSLELVNVFSDNALPENWQASAASGGTPGALNSVSMSGPHIVIAPDSIDFGIVNIDAEKETTVIIRNAGTDSLMISSIVLQGSGMSDFAVEGDTIRALLPGTSADLIVRAVPTSAGIKRDTLLITSNDPDESITYLPLTMVVNSPPSATELVAPGLGETGDVLVWRRARDPENDAILYALEIAEDDHFSEGFYQHHTPDTSITVAELAQNYSFTPQAFYYWRLQATDEHGASSSYSDPGYFQFDPMPTSVAETNKEIPTHFALSQNYPNPFNPETRIQYQLPSASFVTLTVYDLIGKKVVTLVDRRRFSAGTHTVTWSGRSDSGAPVSSGVYFYQIRIEPERNSEPIGTLTRKMLLIK